MKSTHKGNDYDYINPQSSCEKLKEIADLSDVDVETILEIYDANSDFPKDVIWRCMCDNLPPLRKVNLATKSEILFHSKLCTPKKPKKAPKKGRRSNEDEEIIIHTSKIEDNGILYEEIHNNGAVAFIDGNGLTYERLDVGGVAHEPISGDELKEGAVLLPSDIEEYGDEKALIEEIKAHIHKYVDVSDFFETISAYYVLLTWLYDEVNTLPYLRALGDTGCGKSRYEDVVGRICYKATIVSGAITPAPIYRLIRKWRGTIIIDEGDFKASDEQNEVVKILNCGFERGRPVVRSQKDNPDNLQFLPTFSPKILSSRKRFKDVALESRCLTEVMRETDRDDIPYLLPQEFYDVEASLRNKLLKFRFKNHGHVDILKAQKLKSVKVEDRLKQAVSSFIVLFANNEEIYSEFVEFLEAYNSELVEERLTTYEGGIVQAIFYFMPVKARSVTLTNVTNITNVTEAETRNESEKSRVLTDGDLSCVEITATDIQNVMIEALGYKEDYTTSRSIGKRLRVLGITTKRQKTKDKKTKALLVLEARPLTKLFKKYLPVAVIKNNDSYDSYICYGVGGENEIKKLKSKGLGSCELCGKEEDLGYEMKEGDTRNLICAECAKEEIERIQKEAGKLYGEQHHKEEVSQISGEALNEEKGKATKKESVILPSTLTEPRAGISGDLDAVDAEYIPMGTGKGGKAKESKKSKEATT